MVALATLAAVAFLLAVASVAAILPLVAKATAPAVVFELAVASAVVVAKAELSWAKWAPQHPV